MQGCIQSCPHRIQRPARDGAHRCSVLGASEDYCGGAEKRHLVESLRLRSLNPEKICPQELEHSVSQILV